MIRKSTINLNFANIGKISKIKKIADECNRIINLFIKYLWEHIVKTQINNKKETPKLQENGASKAIDRGIKMFKDTYNLLVSTSGVTSLASTNGTTVFVNRIIDNDYAYTGRLFVYTKGYAGLGSTAISFYLYQSPDGYDWFKHSNLCSWSTANASAFPLTSLGRYLRFAYTSGRTYWSNAEVRLELDVEKE